MRPLLSHKTLVLERAVFPQVEGAGERLNSVVPVGSRRSSIISLGKDFGLYQNPYNNLHLYILVDNIHVLQ